MTALLHPWFLLLALLVPLAIWLRRRRGTPAVLFAPGTAELPRSWRVRLLPLPRLLHMVGLGLTVLALARPVHRAPVPITTEGIDIMLCLDTSSSMTSNDLDPKRSRLDVAKGAAAQFVAGRPDDRIGLVGFARYPDLRCPPTLDHDALAQFLKGVAPVESDGPEDATGIGTAVARAAQVLRRRAKSKVVILLTDGEENVASEENPDEIAPLHAGQLSRELGVRVYAIAAGLGEDVDTTQVQRLAEQTGGRFFRARDRDAVAQVYREIDELERVEFEEPRFENRDRFLAILAAALSLLLVGRLLSASVLGVLP